MTNTTLGQRIAEERKKLGLSQEAFGDRLGVSRQAASKWESDAAVPEIDKLITMSKIFGVSIGWLLGVEDPEEEPSLSEEQLSAVTELLCRYPAPCPERKNRRWILWAGAAGLAVSLTLGVLGLCFPQTDTDALQEQLDSLSDRNIQLQQEIRDLTAQMPTDYLVQEDLEKVEEMIQQITATEPEETLPPIEQPTVIPEVVHPANELLDRWTLTAAVNYHSDHATLRFSGAAKVAAAEARLTAVKGSEELSAICALAEDVYTAELALPLVDGYTYYFQITDMDGAQQQVELTGHGLSSLSVASGIQLRYSFDHKGSPGRGQNKFWLSDAQIRLSVPDLIPDSTVCTWSDLRISYYCNNIATDQWELVDNLQGQSEHARHLNYSFTTLHFDLGDKHSGSTHDLWLEGTVSGNGWEYTFSLPLGYWVLRGDGLV